MNYSDWFTVLQGVHTTSKKFSACVHAYVFSFFFDYITEYTLKKKLKLRLDTGMRFLTTLLKFRLGL